MRRASLIALILVSSWAVSVSLAQNESKRAPSTPEERQRSISLTHKLEQEPLDKSLYPEVKWAKKWLDDIPDVNVTVCAPFLFGVDSSARRTSTRPSFPTRRPLPKGFTSSSTRTRRAIP